MNHPRHHRPLHAVASAVPVVTASLIGALACATPHELDVTVKVVDESGQPVPLVTVRWAGGEARTDDRGKAEVRELAHPVMTVLSCDGYLDEPVPLGWEDDEGTVEVTLLRDGAGSRIVVHAGGDVMFGRRFVDPDEDGAEFDPGEGLIVPGDGGDSARALVVDLAPAFAAAHLRMINHEAVVGTFDVQADAYPGKRWILQSAPDALAALDEMAVDLAVLGNDHLRDFREPGIESTLDAVRAAGLADVGGGLDAAAAETPVLMERQGVRVGVLSYTSVDGAYVNDAYPRDGDTPPDDLDPAAAWQWDARVWGWSGSEVQIPVAERRIGSAWEALLEVEEALVDGERADLWDSAAAVYPELQDWVARRGHGGGAAWDDLRSPGQISQLRTQADLVIVHLHGGYEFAADPGRRLRDAASAAADAGANLVIGHHPHVLQGVEFRGDTLIAWSLGNLIFDHDFLATFPSAFLRTVWENGQLLQARLIPLTLQVYRPVPVVDSPARTTLRTLWAHSLAGATARRGDDLRVRSELPGDPAAGELRLVLEHHTARIEPDVATKSTVALTLAPDEIAELPRDGLVWSTLAAAPPEDIRVGRSLFAWGGFEDADTDASVDDADHWVLSGSGSIVAERAWTGRRCLELTRDAAVEGEVLVHPVTQIPVPDHRWHDGDGDPADGAARYSLHAAVRVKGQEDLGSLRVAYLHLDDTDPTAAPVSVLVRERDYPLRAAHGDAWRDLWIHLPPADLAPDPDGRPITGAMLDVVMGPATERDTAMYFDDLELVEWRTAAEQPEVWGAWDYARNVGDETATFETATLPW